MNYNFKPCCIALLFYQCIFWIRYNLYFCEFQWTIQESWKCKSFWQKRLPTQLCQGDLELSEYFRNIVVDLRTAVFDQKQQLYFELLTIPKSSICILVYNSFHKILLSYIILYQSQNNIFQHRNKNKLYCRIFLILMVLQFSMCAIIFNLEDVIVKYKCFARLHMNTLINLMPYCIICMPLETLQQISFPNESLIYDFCKNSVVRTTLASKLFMFVLIEDVIQCMKRSVGCFVQFQES
eukprot:TRINITY_DN3180_c0_g2_i1.p1 TRINITY_DN3180_c0_g2~~TRINITY_DN3180_c0_g2_i1.p1  ORF type:complete len:238 (-),score=-17.68 TRINITY_DN3180_c0_g2_i1:165-878(-)